MSSQIGALAGGGTSGTSRTSGTSAASAGGGTGSTGSTVAALQAQLDRYQHQLSDCVNCSSAKTPEGRRQIDALSRKISDARDRIQQAQAGRESSAAPATPAAPERAAGSADSAPGSTSAPRSPLLTVGSVIDAYA